MNTLGQKITDLRKAQNMTQEELASRVGVSRQAISKWERGEGLPDLYNLKNLARVLRVDVDELVNDVPRAKAYQTEDIDHVEVAGNYIKKLLFKAKHTTNSKEAKRIKKALIQYGIAGVVIGIAMILGGFFGFASGAFNSVNNFPMPGQSSFNPIPYMIVFMLGGVVTGISVYVLYGGLGIYVAEVTTRYLDTREKCPQCGDEIDSDEKVCSSCGYKIELERTCPLCGKINQPDDNFCRECGTKLK